MTWLGKWSCRFIFAHYSFPVTENSVNSRFGTRTRERKHSKIFKLTKCLNQSITFIAQVERSVGCGTTHPVPKIESVVRRWIKFIRSSGFHQSHRWSRKRTIIGWNLNILVDKEQYRFHSFHSYSSFLAIFIFCVSRLLVNVWCNLITHPASHILTSPEIFFAIFRAVCDVVLLARARRASIDSDNVLRVTMLEIDLPSRKIIHHTPSPSVALIPTQKESSRTDLDLFVLRHFSTFYYALAIHGIF